MTPSEKIVALTYALTRLIKAAENSNCDSQSIDMAKQALVETRQASPSSADLVLTLMKPL